MVSGDLIGLSYGASLVLGGAIGLSKSPHWFQGASFVSVRGLHWSQGALLVSGGTIAHILYIIHIIECHKPVGLIIGLGINANRPIRFLK